MLEETLERLQDDSAWSINAGLPKPIRMFTIEDYVDDRLEELKQWAREYKRNTADLITGPHMPAMVPVFDPRVRLCGTTCCITQAFHLAMIAR